MTGGIQPSQANRCNVLSAPLPEDRNEAGATEKSLWLTPSQENTEQFYAPVHLRPAATVIPTSDIQMTTHWLDKPGQEDSPQPQSSVAEHPYYQVSTVLQTGARTGKATGEPSSLSLRHHPPGLWPFPQGSQCGGPVALDGGTPKEAFSWDSAPDI